jgi:hypothetical protein
VFHDYYHVRKLWSVNPNRILTHSKKETGTFVVVVSVVIVVAIITVIIAITAINAVWPQNSNNLLNDINVFILQWVKRGSGALLPSSLSHDLVSLAYIALTSF